MIKVLKDGKDEFTARCPACSCKFSYEVEDFSSGLVHCPYCGSEVTHTNKRFGFKSKKLTKESKHNLYMFFVKLLIYIILGLTVWYFSAAKYRNTEKDVGENIVAEEIDEGVEEAIELG